MAEVNRCATQNQTQSRVFRQQEPTFTVIFGARCLSAGQLVTVVTWTKVTAVTWTVVNMH
jgi:hypothetical protein